MLFDTLSLLKAASYSVMHEKAWIIVDSFLNKSDFLIEQSKLKNASERIDEESDQYLNSEE